MSLSRELSEGRSIRETILSSKNIPIADASPISRLTRLIPYISDGLACYNHTLRLVCIEQYYFILEYRLSAV